MRIVAECGSKALRSNYQIIRELSGRQGMLPMIKANAYGHGDEWAARELLGSSGLYGFGVATMEEGVELRKNLGPRGKRAKIIVFSGTTPWMEEKGRLCERHGLTAVITSDQDWHSFFKSGWCERIAYELKFNTGMNRLGMSSGMAKTIARILKNRSSVEHPSGVFSHLAIGENPDHKLSRMQRELFQSIRSEMASNLPSAQFHLANSAAIWNRKSWRLDDLTDVVRPGLALYGARPWKDAPARGIEPVMSLLAEVIAVRKLKAGESVGYGATFKATEATDVAILGAGYADGIHRLFSNQGHAWLGGKPRRFLGIVSMDLSAVSCAKETQVGDQAEILGSQLDIWEQARAAGTIPYELLTSVSTRVQRKYV